MQEYVKPFLTTLIFFAFSPLAEASCPNIDNADPFLRPTLERLFTGSPQKVRSALCMGPFVLKDELPSMGYTEMTGTTFINKDWIKNLSTASMDHLLTWKEQLNFDVEKKSTFKVDRDLPTYEAFSDQPISALDFLILHEIAHRLRETPQWGEWMQAYLASMNSLQVGPIPCFYLCQNPSDLIRDFEILPFYKHLFENKDLLDLYALVQPEEEFADAYAFYILIKYFGLTRLELKFKDVTVDLVGTISSVQYKRKRDVISPVVDDK